MELPNYSKQLMQQLRTLRKEGQFCDCTVLVGDSSHRAHKVVLAASSLLFRSLIDHSDSISIDTAVVSSLEFECLLDMVYTGKLPPGKHNVSRIIAAADSLQMFDVAVGCKNILTTLMNHQPTVLPQSDDHTDPQVSKLHSVQPDATPSPKKGDLISRKVTTKAGPAGVQVRCQVEKAGSENETGDEELCSESAKEEEMEEDMREDEQPPCEIPGTQIDSQGDGPESTSSTDQATCKEEEAEDDDDDGEEEESGEEEKKPKEKGGKKRVKVLQSEQPYSCRWCKKGFAYKCRMLAHTKRCPMSKEFKHQCLLCSEKLATPRALQRHRSEAHPDAARTKKKAVCDICGRTFAHPSGMIYHKRTEHFDEKPFACQECGAKFGANSSLKNHMRLHTGEKPYLCKHCDMTFTVAAALAYHTKKKHSEGKMYACQYCEALFAQSIELTRHVRTHTGDRPYVCRECGKGYSQASGLTVHLQTFHNISEPHDCQKCRLSFSSLEDHRQHIQECHPKDFKSSLGCPVCNKMFTSTALLEKHKSTHAGSKPFNCDICLKSYQQLSGLWYHNRTTHPEVFLNQSNRHLKPLVQCEVCFKFFPNTASLTRHHEAEHAVPEVSAVRCPFCPGVFPSEEELQEHAKTRHPSQEGSAFGCSLCPTVCASQHLLQEHFLTCHVAATADEQAEQGGGEEQESTPHTVIQREQSASEGAETNISLDQSQIDGSEQVLVALGDREDGGPPSEVVEVNVDDLLNGTVTFICGGNQ